MSLFADLRDRTEKLRGAKAVVERAWKHPWTGWLLLVFFSIWFLWWRWHIPTVGYAIAVLAVAAAAMSVLHEPGTFARMGWILLLFGFLSVEMYAIDEDKKKSTAELTQHFNEVSAEAQSNLKDILRNEEKNLSDTFDRFMRQERALRGLQSQEAAVSRSVSLRNLVDAAPRTITELQLQYENWNSEDTNARKSSGKNNPEYIKTRDQLAEQYTLNLKSTLTDANKFREQLFNALPEILQRRYAANQRVGSILQSAINGQTIHLSDLKMVTNFLNNLAQAVSALPPAEDDPSPHPTSRASERPSTQITEGQQELLVEQRGSERSPLVIKIVPPDQTGSTSQSSNHTWALSDKIAVIAMAAAALQFLALVATISVMVSGSRRQLRAYVGGEVGSIGNVANPIPVPGLDIKPTGAEITNPSCGPVAYVQIKNAGQTPAYEVVHWGSICTREYPLTSTLPDPQFISKGASVLGPGIIATKYLFLASPLTALEISNLRAGTAAVYVYGEIRYKDAFGKPRFTKYRLMHHVGQGAIGINAGLTFADDGNEAN